MSKKLFREADRKLLSNNPFVSKISEKSIRFTEEFERLFIDQHMSGHSPKDICENNGINIYILDGRHVEQGANQ